MTKDGGPLGWAPFFFGFLLIFALLNQKSVVYRSMMNNQVDNKEQINSEISSAYWILESCLDIDGIDYTHPGVQAILAKVTQAENHLHNASVGIWGDKD